MIKWENYEKEENEIILRFDGMIEHKQKSYEFQENSTQSKKHKIPRRWNDQKWKNKQMNWRID